MPEKVEINLATDDAQRAIDALKSKADALKATLQEIASTLGSNPDQRQAAAFFSTAAQLSSVQGAMAAISGSATVGGPPGAAIAAGAMAGAASFARKVQMRSVEDPQGILNTLQGAGVGTAGMSAAALYLANGQIPVAPGAAFNPASYVAQVVAQSVTPAAPPPVMGPYLSDRITPFARSGMERFGGGLVPAGLAGTRAVGDYFSYSSQRILQGGDDPMARARGIGGAIGALPGIVIGAVAGNPLLGTGITVAGSQIGGAVAEWLAAPEAARQSASLAISPLMGAVFGPSYGPKVNNLTARFEALKASLNRGPLGAMPELQVSAGDIGATFGNVAGGMFAGGMNPFAPSGQSFRAGEEQFQIWGGMASRSLTSGRLFNGIVATAGTAVAATLRQPETMAETFTRRLSQLFGKAAPDVAKSIGQIFGSVPETGDNVADILTRFGPEATSTYLRIQNENLVGSVSPDTLAASSAAIRRGQRLATLGSLQIRGSGQAALTAIRGEMADIERLPGGRDSLAFAQARQQAHSAQNLMFQQQDILGFDIPMTHLQGSYERMQMLPFAPGNVLGTAMQIGQRAAQQAVTLQRRMISQRQAGMLSEDDELHLSQQIESLQTMATRSIAMLSEGFENRLPALHAGTPRTFSRYNSFQLAAMASRGSAIRSFGAMGGGQLAEQDSFLAPFGGAAMAAPYSRTAGMNMGGAGQAERMVSLLERLVNAVERGGGGSKMRSGEAAGAVASAIYGKRTGNETGGVN